MFVVEITAVARHAHRASPTSTGLAAGHGTGGPRLPGPDRASGCGSRSCSRPTPRPSPRRAAAPRRRRCAGRARRRPPTAAAPTGRSRTSARPSCARATSSSSRRARRSPATATSSRASAYVNEAAITGESAPVLKEPGTDIRSSVTGGTTLVSDRLVDPRHRRPGRDVPRPDDRPRRGRQAPAHAERDRARDPARRPDDRLPDGDRDAAAVRRATPASTVDTVALVALLVCLIPTTIGGLLSAIGIAGMDRVARFNVLAMSGRAVEASGDVDVILLDKTGTITYGNRLAVVDHRRRPASTEAEVARRRRSSPRSATRRPRAARSSTLARERLARARRARPATATTPASRRSAASIAEEIPFRAETRTSGVRTDRRRARSSRAPSTRSRRASTARCRPRSLAETDADRRPRRHAPGDPRATAGSSASSSSRTRSRRGSSSGSPSSAGWASGP